VRENFFGGRDEPRRRRKEKSFLTFLSCALVFIWPDRKERNNMRGIPEVFLYGPFYCVF
jgi:hypothetical protein